MLIIHPNQPREQRYFPACGGLWLRGSYSCCCLQAKETHNVAHMAIVAAVAELQVKHLYGPMVRAHDEAFKTMANLATGLRCAMVSATLD